MRKEVKRFANDMEKTLRIHDKTKSHWSNATRTYLLGKLRDEVEELDNAIALRGNQDIRAEAIDVANFAMMIWDNA